MQAWKRLLATGLVASVALLGAACEVETDGTEEVDVVEDDNGNGGDADVDVTEEETTVEDDAEPTVTES